VSAEPVGPIPECEERGRPRLPADEDRWRAYHDDEDEVRFFRVDCARREFDPDATGS
jgi:hypothetical protein